MFAKADICAIAHVRAKSGPDLKNLPDNPSARPTTYQQTPFFDRFSIKDY